MKQHVCEAQGPDHSLWLDSSASVCSAQPYPALPPLLHSGTARFLWCFILSVFSSIWGNAVFNLWCKGKELCSQSHRETNLYKQKSLSLVPDGVILCNEECKSLQYDWLKRHCPDQNGATLMRQ